MRHDSCDDKSDYHQEDQQLCEIVQHVVFSQQDNGNAQNDQQRAPTYDRDLRRNTCQSAAWANCNFYAVNVSVIQHFPGVVLLLLGAALLLPGVVLLLHDLSYALPEGRRSPRFLRNALQ